MGGFAWVTLATNDSYSLGALVLAHSLRAVGTQQQLAVLVTPGVTAPMREKLSQVFNLVQEVNILDSKDEANLRLLQRPELGVTFTKLHCWRLTQYDKCVFLDADTLVLDNVDELFEREEFSAAPDVGWPDCFNSGVFVFKPSNETYDNLVKFALEKGSFDGGDQGLLNLYFSDWAHKDISKHLPFIYNMCSTACYSYLPAFKQFGSNVKIVHFIGATKPWLQYFDTESRQVRPAGGMQHLQVVLQRWWDIFCTMIHPVLTPEMGRSDWSEVDIPSQSLCQDEIESNTIDYRDVSDPWEHYDENQSISNQSTDIPTDSDLFQTPPSNSSYETCIASPPPVQCSLDSSESSTVSQQRFSDTNIDSLQSSQSSYETCVFQPSTSNLNLESDQMGKPSPVEECKHVPHNITVTHNETNLDDFKPYSSPPPFQAPVTKETYSVINASHTFASSCVFETKVITNIPKTQPQPNSPNSTKPQTWTPAADKTLPKTESTQNDAGLAGAFAQFTLGSPRTGEQSALEDHLRRQGWEVGNIDYMGADSFDNIWSKICKTMAAAPAQPSKSREPSPTRDSPSEQTTEVKGKTRKSPQKESDPKLETKAEPVLTSETPESDPKKSGEVSSHESAPSSHEEAPKACPNQIHSLTQETHKSDVQVCDKPAQSSAPLKEDLSACQSPPQPAAASTNEGTQEASPSEQTKPSELPQTVDSERIQDPIPSEQNIPLEPAQPIDPIPADQKKLSESAQTVDSQDKQVSIQSEQKKPSEPAQTVDSEKSQAPIPSEQDKSAVPAQTVDSGSSQAPIPSEQIKSSEPAQSVDSEKSQAPISSEQNKSSEPAQTVDSASSQAPIPSEQDKSSEPAQTVDSGSTQAPIPSEPIKSSEPIQTVDSEKSQAPIPSEQDKSSEPAEAVESESTQKKPSEPAQTAKSEESQDPIPSEQTKPSEPAQTVDSKGSDTPLPTPKTRSKNKNGQKVSTPSSPSVTEATPPTSPSASALPTNVEPSLGVETDVPATPPPKETAAASPPTPPPRKGSGAKKPGSAKK